MPQVSVIMNCHNGAGYLREALDSVYQQTFRDYEIVFWNNSSNDRSGEIALGYGDPLRYFLSEEFLPLGAARNAAIKKATGKYIALLDCDDVWLPEKLEKQLALLEGDPDLAMVYSDAVIVDEANRVKEGSFFRQVEPFNGDAFWGLLTRNDNPIICSTVVFKRDVFEQVGGFRPDLTIAEEYDLFLWMASLHKISHLDLPLARLRQYEGSYSRKNRIRTGSEKIDVLEKAIDLPETISRAQARILKKKLLRLSLGLILAHAAEKKYAYALVLPFTLARKYFSISAKLKSKDNRSKRYSWLRHRFKEYSGIFTRSMLPKANNDWQVFVMMRGALESYTGPLKGNAVLDIGCGQLYPLSLLFQKMGNSVVGIDINYIGAGGRPFLRCFTSLRKGGVIHFLRDILYLLLGKSRKYYRALGQLSGFDLSRRSVDIRQMDAGIMSFPDESFDVVVSNAVFEHVVDLHRVVTETKRVLRRGGMACIRINLFAGVSGGHVPQWETLPPWYHLRDYAYAPLDYLNRLRKDDFLQPFAEGFKLLETIEEKRGEQWLTEELRAELAGYSEDDLLTECITIVAQRDR